MSGKVSVGQMASAIMESLNEYADLTADDMKKAVKKSAKTVKDEISANAADHHELLAAYDVNRNPFLSFEANVFPTKSMQEENGTRAHNPLFTRSTAASPAASLML